jgi:hypothetical protein
MKNYNFISADEAGMLVNVIQPSMLSENFIPKIDGLSEGEPGSSALSQWSFERSHGPELQVAAIL